MKRKKTIASTAKPAPISIGAKPPAPVTLSLRFLPKQGAKLTLLIDDGSSTGRVLCTLVVDESGLEYRKWNAKKPPGRKLSWDSLDRFMRIGLV